MRILVTGGAGYVGSVLVRELVSREHEVILVDLPSRIKSYPDLHLQDGVRVVTADLRQVDAIGSVGEFDSVVHLAAMVGYPACDAAPDHAHAINVEGTRNILKIAAGRPVILLSSLSVLGPVSSKYCDETTTPRPVSTYGQTKLEAERLAAAYGHCVILRPATAFGASPRTRFDLLVHDFIRAAVLSGEINVYQPEAKRCFVHVKDLVLTVMHSLDSYPDLRGQIFHVGNGKLNVTKRHLAELIQAATDCSVRFDMAGADKEVRDYGGDFSKLEGTGMQLRRGLEDGIQDILITMGGWPAPARIADVDLLGEHEQ